MQLGRDWEEGLPWLMLAPREVTQDSSGFSPNKLVFLHMVWDQLAVVSSDWRDSEPPENLLYFVNGF